MALLQMSAARYVAPKLFGDDGVKIPHGDKMLAFRRAAPEWLKRDYRLLRLATTLPPPAAPDIPQHLLDGCRMMSTRLQMLDALPRDARVAEVGTLYGHFAMEILRRCAPREFHILDISFAALDDGVRAHPAVTLHQGLSASILAGFADASFDWIYIDADHSYEAVCQDAAIAARKVKPGGYLAFNDFARIARPGVGIFGVHQAVCEFAVSAAWPFAFFCLNGEALYDVALRRPAA